MLAWKWAQNDDDDDDEHEVSNPKRLLEERKGRLDLYPERLAGLNAKA